MTDESIKNKMAMLAGLCGMKMLPSSISMNMPIFDVGDIARNLGFYITENTTEENALCYTEEVFKIADPAMYKFFEEGKLDGIPEDSVYKMLMMIDTDIAYKFRDFVVRVIIPYFKKNYNEGKNKYAFMSDTRHKVYGEDQAHLNYKSSKNRDFNNWFTSMDKAFNDISYKNSLSKELLVNEALERLQWRNEKYINGRLLDPATLFFDDKLKKDFEMIVGEMFLKYNFF